MTDEVTRLGGIERKICWRITRRCNLSCMHCLAGHENRERGNIDVGAALDCLQKIRDVGVTRITWTGGEPTLAEPMLALIQRCHEYGLSTVMTTHGVSTRPAVLEALDPRSDRVRLSFDGLQDTHDVIRGGRFFGKTIKTAEQMLARGFRTEANISVLGENVEQIPDLIALLAKVGLHRFVLLTLMMRESAVDNALKPPSLSQIEQLRASVSRLRLSGIDIQMNDYGTEGDTYIVVESDGEVFLCTEHADDISFGFLSDSQGEMFLSAALSKQTLAHRDIAP